MLLREWPLIALLPTAFCLPLSSHFLIGHLELYILLHEGNYEETLSMTSQGWEMLESSLTAQFLFTTITRKRKETVKQKMEEGTTGQTTNTHTHAHIYAKDHIVD